MDGRCSLRAAVKAANADTSVSFCFHDGSGGRDTIQLKAGTYGLTEGGNDDNAENGDLDVTEDLVIQGAGAGKTIIDAADLTLPDRVFRVLNSSTKLVLKDLTVTGGNTTANGGGIANSGTLVLQRVTVRGNTGWNGGGVFHFFGATDMTIRNSTISSNIATEAGGGIGINRGGSDLSNSTVSGNRAEGHGGGIFAQTAGGTGFHSLTVADNRADSNNDGAGDGGGLYFDTVGGSTLENTLVATNRDGTAGTNAPDCLFDGSPLVANHDNFIGDDQNCNFSGGTGNIRNRPPGIRPLRNNGGTTRTHALRASSRAVGSGSGCPSTDQRRVPRNGCDIGAYERAICRGVLVNRVGTGGKDKLTGTSEPDGVLAFGGKDVVATKGGKDGLCLGGGNDRGSGGGGNDRMLGERGNDRLRGGSGNDLLVGGAGTDVCRGGPGRDVTRSC